MPISALYNNITKVGVSIESFELWDLIGKRTIIRAFQRAQNQLHISIRSGVMSILVIGQSERSITKTADVSDYLGHDMNICFGIFRSRTV